MGGDNLNQNFPLRLLAGELIRHGRLPLWNPDIWSGAPLLAGWNAGAMYPGTWLFAVLPGVVAWELNVISVGILAGVGLYAFLRREGCSPVASLLGALCYAYTGFMSGQSVHLGLVTGMALAPWMLVAVQAMGRARRHDDGRWTEQCAPVALLGAAVGCAVLAGDPRAISNDALVLAAYLVATCWRRRRATAAVLTGALAGTVLGAALSAVQWLPGLAFLHQSQRAGGNLAAFGAYSVHAGQLAYLFAPFLFGGNGSLGLPTTNFNLPEYTYAVGVLPLVACCVLAARALVGPRRASPPALVWLALVAVGIVLSLGTNTPLGHLLVHVPLYGGERLQNRNMGVVDLALAVLVALFLDLFPARAGSPDPLPATADVAGPIPAWAAGAPDSSGTGSPVRPVPGRLSLRERLAGAVPPLAVVALVVAMLVATAPTERWLGATSLELGLPVRMAPWYGFAAVSSALALAVVVRQRWKRPGRRRQMAVLVVGAEVAMFLAMASYQLAPAAALAGRNAAVSALVGAAGGPGRQAILNPRQLQVASDPGLLADLGVDDLAIVHHLASVQGYGSAVSATYEAATATHEVQNLSLRALAGHTFDDLDLRVLATVPELFGTLRSSAETIDPAEGAPRPPGSETVPVRNGNVVTTPPLPLAGPWRLGSGGVGFELPGPLALDRVVVRLAGPGTDAGTPRRLGIVVRLASGGELRTTAVAGASLAVASLPRGAELAGGGALGLTIQELPGGNAPLVARAVAVRVAPWSGGAALTSASRAPGTAWFQLDGVLQGLLAPSRWSYAGHVGPVVLYRNLLAGGAAWLQPGGSLGSVTMARAPGRVTPLVRAEWQDPAEVVVAPQGGTLVRSAAYAQGWTASIQPETHGAPSGGSVPLRVHAVGLLQGVQLPPGSWQVTWSYGSSRATAGFAAGLAGLILTGALLACAGLAASRRQRAGDAGQGRFRTGGRP